MNNLKLAFRRLFKAPFVTSVAILSLALGIGANAAIFSLFNQMLLGLRPAIGRLLSPQDDQKLGESLVVVLSHAYWTTRFDRNPGVLNDTLIVNGQHLTIVGVAPEGFDGTTLGARPQVFVPITLRGLMNPGFNQFHNR